MVLFNYSTKELTAKVVYYGPGLCGKTTNLQFIHGNLGDEVRGKMLSLATKTDRTLFFDFLPIDLGDIRGMKTRVQLYTVPGQVFYNETRRLVLKGADGIVFVADSQKEMLNANIESFKNLEENLRAHGMNLAEMPHVIQYNKRDLPKLGTIEEFNAAINKYNAPFYESVATTGIGVQDTLKAIVKLVLLNLTKKYDPDSKSAQDAKLPESKPVRSDPAPAVETEAPVVPDPPPAVDSPGAKPGPPPPPNFHAPQASLEPEAPDFDDDEIDDLVGEVQESPPMAATPPEPPDFGIPLSEPTPGGAHAGGGLQTSTASTPEVPPPTLEPQPQGPFVVDRDFDPEWGTGAPTEVEITEVEPESDVDSDAGAPQRIEAGAGPQEIVVPLEVADGDRVVRYRLTLRVRVDEQVG